MDKNSKFQAALKAESDIGKRIAMLAFDMSMAFNPYQAIRDWEVENETANEIAEAPIAAAAAKLGIPFAELQGKEEKTEEELAAIREAEEGLVQMHRAAFARTRYGRALLVLDALSSDPLPVGDEDTYPPCTEAVIRFFALHPEINPREDAAIESEDLKELVELYDELLVKTADEANGTSTPAHELAPIERIKAIRVDSLSYPLDKVNSTIWSMLERDTRGQIMLKVEKVGTKKELSILYSINFDELEVGAQISRKLTSHDKRVYIAAAALYNAGNEVFSLQQIYRAMGYAGAPGKTDREKISASLAKMRGAVVTIDNRQEAAAYNYPVYTYEGSLLPMETIKKAINGKVTEEAVHLFREPPAMTFARQRNQITTIPISLLQSPMSKTEANFQIEDYLLERIAHMKKGNATRRMLYKTICEKANITDRKKRERLPDKVTRYLKYYSDQGWIKSFTEEPDGVTIILSGK